MAEEKKSGGTYKGKYFVKNREKYRGRANNVTYRSSWEKYVMEFLDNNPHVKYWNSEETVIHYLSTADSTDLGMKKKRRYFMDFTIWFENGDIHLWEVKPECQCRPPKPPHRMTLKAKSRYMQELYTWQVNQDKWKAAVDVCKKKGWTFKLITESALKQLGFKGLTK